MWPYMTDQSTALGNATWQDADLDLTAKNIIKGGYSYSGQRCTAVKLVLAHEAIADKLVEKVCSLPKLGLGLVA